MNSSEKGQALPLVLVALAIGSLVVAPFVGHASSSLIGSRTYGQLMTGQYSSGAGVEHAIWRLMDGGLAQQLPNPEDSITYQLSESVNGVMPTITVTRGEVIIASDDFESGGWSGGTGWLSAWNNTGDSSIITQNSPRQGSYHLRLRRDTGYVSRSVDLSGQSGTRLQFWAKANSFEGSEKAYCRISANGSDWTTVHTWVVGDDDNIYHFYDIDLSPYTLSSTFRIAFSAAMGQTSDYFYVDDLEIKAPDVYEIRSVAGGRAIRAVVRIVGGAASILSWQVE